MTTSTPPTCQWSATCVKNILTLLLLCYGININTTSTCTNVKYAIKNFNLKVRNMNIWGYTKHKETGFVSNPNVVNGLKESLNSTHISFLITRSLKNANTVRTPTLILVIYEHTCENIATCYPLSAANVAKDSSGSRRVFDILIQENV